MISGTNYNRKQEIVEKLNSKLIGKDGTAKSREDLGIDANVYLDKFVDSMKEFGLCYSELKLFLELIELDIDDRRI